MESAKLYPLSRNRFAHSAVVNPPAIPPKPKLLDEVRQAIRRRHYSDRTEKAYVHLDQALYILSSSTRNGGGGDRTLSFEFSNGGTGQRVHTEPSV